MSNIVTSVLEVPRRHDEEKVRYKLKWVLWWHVERFSCLSPCNHVFWILIYPGKRHHLRSVSCRISHFETNDLGMVHVLKSVIYRTVDIQEKRIVWNGQNSLVRQCVWDWLISDIKVHCFKSSALNLLYAWTRCRTVHCIVI